MRHTAPWKTNYEEMAKKTAIRQVLKYAPMKTDFARAIAVDGAIQEEIGVDMSEIERQQAVSESEYQEVEE